MMDSFVVAINTSDDSEDDEFYERMFALWKTYTKSGGVVSFYSTDFNILSLLQKKMRHSIKDESSAKRFTHVKLHEYFTREQQVLPKRTHPIMKSALQLVSGFVLAATLVDVDLDEELSIK